MRATRTWQQAKLDLWHTKPGRWHRDTVMANKRGFQTTAQCCAMDGSDDRLMRSFNHVEHRVEIGSLRRLSKFRDVGACNEG